MSTMKELRKAKELSQADLARITGLTTFTISRVETGKHRPNYTTKRLIAQAFGVTPEEIEWPKVNKVG